MDKEDIKTLTRKVREVMDKYGEEYPEVKVDRDYFPFKITEEWGECLQAYLMLTKRGRQKGLDEAKIRGLFSEEFADVFGFMLLFAENEGIDIAEALEKKWFGRLKRDGGDKPQE